MMNTSKTIVFFGTDEFSLESLKALFIAGYIIGAVVTKPDSKKNRGHRLSESDVKKFAINNGIEVWQPNNISEIKDKIIKLKKPVAGVLVSYGKIITESIIQLFEPGIINVHPSLLPTYRGPSPIESAIENGDSKTGISIIKLSADMDAGPIYSQVEISLDGHEDQIILRNTLAKLGAEILIKVLPGILDGYISANQQDESKASYCSLLRKKDAELDFEKISSVEAERKIRAHLLHPKSKLNILDHNITVLKSHISDHKKSELYIKCLDNKYLSIDQLIAPSGKIMYAKDFINGYS